MLLKHHPYESGDEPRQPAELRDIGTQIEFGRAMIPIETARHGSMDDIQSAVGRHTSTMETRPWGQDQCSVDPADGSETAHVRYIVWQREGGEHMLITGGQLFVMNDAGDTIERV